MNTAQRLSNEIVYMSEAPVWYHAKTEWDLVDVWISEEPYTCLCGHNPIKEICVIENRYNHNKTIVGNCCVKKFLGLPSHKIFAAFKRVAEDETRSLNKEALEYAEGKGWINDWEHTFYTDTMRKRKMTPKQAAMRARLNRKVTAAMATVAEAA